MINPYGDGGILYKYKKQGEQEYTLIYGRSDTFDPEDITYFFWNECLGIWEEFMLLTPPEVVTQKFPILMSIIGLLPEIYRGELDLGLDHVDPHVVLDLIGLIPVFGETADVTNGILYLIEGDIKNVTISLVSAFGADLVVKGAKYLHKTGIFKTRSFGRLLCVPIQGAPGTSLYLAAPALFSGLNCGGKKIPADSYAALIDKAGIGVEQSRKFTQWLLDDGVDVAIIHKLNERIAAGEVAAVEKHLGIWRQGDELGLPAETLHTLSKDVLLGGGDELLEALAGNGDLVRAWDIVKARNAQIRMDIPSLDVLSKILNNPNKVALGLTDEILRTIKGSQSLAYKDVIKTLDDFGIGIQGKNIDLTDFGKVLDDLVKGDGWTEGTEWTIRYLSNQVDDFAGKSLRFEVYDKWDDISGSYIRITDLIDESNSAYKILYEFKSVQNVPPGKFNEQFVKDLANPDVVDLSQIRWLFDGRKSPSNFTLNMTNAVSDLPLTDELAQKLLFPNATALDLKNAIIADFDEIFELVE